MIKITVSLGELVDKITILEIKKQHISDEDKLQHIINELTMLHELVPEHLKEHEEFSQLHTELREINLSIWRSEDEVRAVSKREPFDERAYIEATRNSHTMNEERFRRKKRINEIGGSMIHEQKSYD